MLLRHFCPYERLVNEADRRIVAGWGRVIGERTRANEIDEYSTMKLNGTIRCCRDLGCNIKAYNFLRSLPRWTPQHDFDESVSCEEAESTTKEHSSSNISTDSITVTHEAKGTITTDEQPSGTTITVNRDSN
ncbi:hypothetical protein Q1695_012021 [Nippostrongylus brasiliensis]|nr:hypothetical protein Q1695_012021 [Nippostrongylus brasiliensis]